MTMVLLFSMSPFQATRPRKKAPIEIPKKGNSQENSISSELFQKLQKRRVKQGDGTSIQMVMYTNKTAKTSGNF